MKPLLAVPLTSALLLALLTGCAEHQATRSAPPPPPSRHHVEPAARPVQAPEPTMGARHPSTATGSHGLPDQTGIPACDDYLASYIACHRAAHIYAANQLEYRYQLMRKSLLKDSMDPDVRPTLAARCNSLATSLRNALHGQSCDVSPADGSSSAP